MQMREIIFQIDPRLDLYVGFAVKLIRDVIGALEFMKAILRQH